MTDLELFVKYYRVRTGQDISDYLVAFYNESKTDDAHQDVIRLVEKLLNIPYGGIQSKSRIRDIADARMIVYVIFRAQGLTLKKVGLIVGGRDHASVIHGLESFDDLYISDMMFRNRAKKVFEILGYTYDPNTQTATKNEVPDEIPLAHS